MTEIIGTVQPGDPGAPTAGQLSAMGYDMENPDLRPILFQTTDSRHPFVPVIFEPAISEGYPRLGPTILVDYPIRATSSKVVSAPGATDAERFLDGFRYVDKLTSYAGATLEVRFGSLPERGTEAWWEIVRTCAAETIRLASGPERADENRDDLRIVASEDLRPRRDPATEPSLGDLFEYYQTGREIPLRPLDTSYMFPRARHTVRRPSGNHRNYDVFVEDTMHTGVGVSLGGVTRTEMRIDMSAYDVDESGRRGDDNPGDIIGVQLMKLSVQGSAVVDTRPDPMDMEGRMFVDDQYALTAARLAFKLSAAAQVQ